MHVHYKVHGSGKELFGDGFVIWYVRDPKLTGMHRKLIFIRIDLQSILFSGPVFGYADYFHGLAIIMDTYSNHNGPHNVGL